MLTFTRNLSIEPAPLQDETILFDPEQNRFCLLNRTASLIWNQLATAQSAEAVAAELCRSFSGATSEATKSDTDKTLQLLASLKFVVETSEEPADGHIPRPTEPGGSDLPSYQSPLITVMNEEEVLSNFQVPVVATTWWGM